MNMIEKVARAICLKHGGDPDAFHSEMGAGWKPWMDYERDAIAAIAAMREPTEKMVEAGDAEFPEEIDGISCLVWERMIDAALKEQR